MSNNTYNLIVGKRWDKGAIDITRGTALGNPFFLKNVNDTKEREVVIEKYKKWLDDKIKNKDDNIISMLNNIVEKVKSGEAVTLGCYCHPRMCHGDYIKELVLLNIDNGFDKKEPEVKSDTKTEVGPQSVAEHSDKTTGIKKKNAADDYRPRWLKK